MDQANDAQDRGNKKFTGKLVWFITGTSSGLGKALVELAIARGDYVTATARNVDSIRHFTTDPKTASQVFVRALDVRAPFAEIRTLAGETIEKWGRIDILVNNAGVGMLGITEEVGAEGYKAQFDTNFFGPLNVANAFLPYMRTQRKGTIVFVGSRSSWRTDIPLLGAYAASKAALTAMAESLAIEIAPLGIKVLNVLPGSIRTENKEKALFLPTVPDALSIPAVKITGTDHYLRADDSLATKSFMDDDVKDESRKHIANYNELRHRTIDWMLSIVSGGDAHKCASAIIDIVTGSKDWPELNMLILGADAEKNIRDKCHGVLKNLDDWKEVTRGIALDH